MKINEVDPRNFDSDVDYYAALNAKPKARTPSEPRLSPAQQDAEDEDAVSQKRQAAGQAFSQKRTVKYVDKEGSAPNGEKYNKLYVIQARDTATADHEEYMFGKNEWGAKKVVDVEKSKNSDGSVTHTLYIVDNHKHGMWKPFKGESTVKEDSHDSPVASAITRRILMQRADLLAKHGPAKVTAAIDDVADFVGDTEEIGSSDVSAWVKHVEQALDGMGESVAEAGYIGGHNRDEPDYAGIDNVPKRIRVRKGSRVMAIPPSALEQFKADGWTEVDQDVAEGWQEDSQELEDWSKEVNKRLYRAHESQRPALARQLSKIEQKQFGSSLNQGSLTELVHSALKALRKGSMVHYDPQSVGQMPFGSMVGDDARIIAAAGVSSDELVGYRMLSDKGIVDNIKQFLQLRRVVWNKNWPPEYLEKFEGNPGALWLQFVEDLGWSKDDVREAVEAKTDDKLLAYYAQRKAEKEKEKQQKGVAEASPRVDSLVTDALKIMQGSSVSDAIRALKTVLGDREYNGRRGHYNFYVKQLVDMSNQSDISPRNESEQTNIKEADMDSEPGRQNILSILKAAEQGQDAQITVGNEPITLDASEARFVSGRYKAFMKAGRQEEFLRALTDARAFDRIMA